MKENSITIRVGDGLEQVAKARGQIFIDWFQDALDLALVVDLGKVFQKTSDGYQELRIFDIKPFPEEPDSKNTYFYTLEKELYDTVKNKSSSFKDWVLRVVSLGLRFENLNLYFFDGEEYKKIVKTPGTPEGAEKLDI